MTGREKKSTINPRLSIPMVNIIKPHRKENKMPVQMRSCSSEMDSSAAPVNRLTSAALATESTLEVP